MSFYTDEKSINSIEMDLVFFTLHYGNKKILPS